MHTIWDAVTRFFGGAHNEEVQAKLTELVDGERRIIEDPPLILHAHHRFDVPRAAFDAYLASLSRERRTLLDRYRLVDAARKVVGVGSVGTRAWVVLLTGRDDADPLVIQVKEAQASVLEAVLPRSVYDNHGQRVVEGQRLGIVPPRRS